MPHPPATQDGSPTPSEQASPRRAPLDRATVMRAALQVIDADGLEALTMRRLGQHLGRDPMALYRYAANRAAVLDGVAELVIDELAVPATCDDWQDQLRRIAHDFRRIALAHPHVVVLLVTRPLATPLGLRPAGTLRPLERILGMLIGAGFTPDDALHIYRAFTGLLNGHVLNELQELVADPDEDDDLLRLGLHRLPAREFPHVRQLASALAHYDGTTELDQGLDILLTGLHTHLHHPP